MNRKRKNGPEWLPVRCYVGRKSYEYHPKGGGSIRLGSLETHKNIILANYEKAKLEHDAPTGAFSLLVKEYFKSRNYKKLGARTRTDYVGYADKVLKVFGHTNRYRITPHHIRKYMDMRAESSETQANREHSFMSAVFSWAYENGKVKLNPCHGVRKFEEPGRDRYIEDFEYNATLDAARDDWVLAWAAMEVSYCCAARQGDVWNLTREQLKDPGVFIKQGKTGVKQIKEWNPRLRKAIDVALAHQKVKNMTYVFAYPDGTRPSQRTMASWFVKAKNKAQENLKACGIKMETDFTFHDIKAKAISDYEGEDKKFFSGHKTDSQVAVYDRKVKITPTLK